MPLNLVDKNKTYTIQRIAGKEEMIHRLEDLGFVPGSQVCVLSEINGNFLEIGLLAILLASSNVNQAVGNLTFTDVTGIKNKLAYQEHINRINERPDTFSIGMVMFDLNICMHTNRKVRKID